MTNGTNPQGYDQEGYPQQQYNQPPGTYGAPQPHFSSDTEKGVRYFSWSVLISLILAIIAVATAIGAYMTLSNLESSTTSEQAVSAGTGALGGLAAAACGIGLLALVSFILIIIGVIKFNHGKNEFPGKHPGNVKLGTLSFILAIIMYILLVSIPFVWMNSLMLASQSSPSQEELWASIRTFALSLSVISMLATIFLGLMYLFMIREIAQPADRTLLYVAFILFLIAAILPLAIIVTVLPADVNNLSQSQLETLPSAIMNIPNIGYIASSIGYILFFIAYWRTKKAMEAGAIAPKGPSYPTVPPYQQPQDQQYPPQ